ncbi:MAG: prepilin-type N-terminal cleavage/methylation domain-containing protein [Oscillospiraceae bacterium]|nr:prepilin-type N-terminal cleavage/methylation domain-containing protein [Oscillospiraceae bacterium]
MTLQKIKQKVHDGFTLLEMIVVVGIIGILLLVAVPAISNYYTNSRLNSANSDAKVLFNSMQTVMQEYEFSERSAKESFFYGTAKTGDLFMVGKNGSIEKYYINATDATTANFTTADKIGAGTNPASATVGGRLIRLYPDYKTTSWCIYVKDYRVLGVVAASASDSHFVGGYPLKAAVKNDTSVIGTSTIGNLSVSTMKAYCTRAWA